MKNPSFDETERTIQVIGCLGCKIVFSHISGTGKKALENTPLVTELRKEKPLIADTPEKNVKGIGIVNGRFQRGFGIFDEKGRKLFTAFKGQSLAEIMAQQMVGLTQNPFGVKAFDKCFPFV